jgi:hypothetical protein
MLWQSAKQKLGYDILQIWYVSLMITIRAPIRTFNSIRYARLNVVFNYRANVDNQSHKAMTEYGWMHQTPWGNFENQIPSPEHHIPPDEYINHTKDSTSHSEQATYHFLSSLPYPAAILTPTHSHSSLSLNPFEFGLNSSYSTIVPGFQYLGNTTSSHQTGPVYSYSIEQNGPETSHYSSYPSLDSVFSPLEADDIASSLLAAGPVDNLESLDKDDTQSEYGQCSPPC